MIPYFVINKGGSRFVTVIYDETEIFVIKNDFCDGFGFVIKIFVIEVDIPSSVCWLSSACSCLLACGVVKNCPWVYRNEWTRG